MRKTARFSSSLASVTLENLFLFMPRFVTDSGQCVPFLLSDFSALHAIMH